MADLDTLELDTLRAEFHRVVNMTSQELSAWLTTYDADPLTPPAWKGSVS
jgi:hypothetical protein